MEEILAYKFSHFSSSACTFLRLAGNSDILLGHALDDGESSQEVINVLQQYLSDSAVDG